MTDSSFPEFTDHSLHLIADSLPPKVNPKRLDLLSRIFREWAQIDLPEHLSREANGRRRKRIGTLRSIDNYASKLLRALSELEQAKEECWIAYGLGVVRERPLNRTEAADLENQFRQGCEFLKNLSSGAAAAANSLHVDCGRPRNLAAYLVLRDIASIFQWVTGTEASRSVDRADGKEIGPFWQFASAVWPVVFGKGDDGFSTGTAFAMNLGHGSTLGLSPFTSSLPNVGGPYLVQGAGPHRNIAREWPIVRGDQQNRCGHPGGKDGQRDGRSQPVGAVDHGDRDKRTPRLQDQAQPFHRIEIGPSARLSLGDDGPGHSGQTLAPRPPWQTLRSRPILGGLHHQYALI
jgi:hypothetical protein